MEPMQDKDFDQLFKQRLENFEVEPASRSWENITKELDGSRKKRKNFPAYWMAAASVVFLTSAILWLYKPDDVIRLQGKPQIAAVEKSTDTEIQLEDEIPAKYEKKNVATLQESTLVAHKANKAEKKYSVTKELPVIEKKTVDPKSQVLLAKQEMKTTPPDVNRTALSPEADPVVLAQENTNQDESSNDTEAFKPRIKSIGGLVNFVIAQVDKRDDKIIEFKDGQEGSEVSGINLGPLKFKSRK